jgi:protein JSN1
MTSSRSEHPTLGHLPSAVLQPRSGSPTANSSPTELTASATLRSPFGFPPGITSSGKMAGASRSGAGSPSHELGGAARPFSKRFV